VAQYSQSIDWHPQPISRTIVHNTIGYGWLFLLHILLAIVSAYSSTFTKFWGIGIILAGLFDIIRSSNRNDRAAQWAAYAMGLEVLLRMRDAYITYEGIKYVVIIFLITGLLFERRSFNYPVVFIFLFVLLLPSLLITELPPERFRKALLFNLSGPLVLLVSCFYFYKRQIKVESLRSILIGAILPILSMAIVIQLISPDLSEVKFTAESNYETSGGFGPNQVATVLGCGAFFITLLYLFKVKITGSRIFDLLIFALLVFRGLITFSRGGMLAVVLALGAFSILLFLFNHPLKGRISKYFILVIPLSIWGWLFIVDLTDGQIQNRYLGLSARGEQVKTIATGREQILITDYIFFAENPILGVGVGMSSFLRERRFGFFAASHSEFGRLIAEHGSFGVIFLISLVALVLLRVYSRTTPAIVKIWCITFFIYAILSINHSALRIALPGFIFGLIFISITPNLKFQQKKPHLNV
jgi:O-antigen ligase